MKSYGCSDAIRRGVFITLVYLVLTGLVIAAVVGIIRVAIQGY